MTGNLGYDPDNPLFLLDESLAPAVAQALRLVGYNIADVETAFGHKGVKDPEIIEWCRTNQAIWIHADDRARRQHRAQFQTSGIRTIWVFRSRGRMTGRDQLRILSFVLPKMIAALDQGTRHRHYRASATNPTSTPSFRPVTI